MSYPKALRGDDEYAEVRPKQMGIQTSKITPTNPLSFADKSAQAVGPSRGFEPPPQAMELPHWETPISPATHADFPYPSKGIGPPQSVLDHPMKAKGYMKHAEKVKRELEDMQVCKHPRSPNRDQGGIIDFGILICKWTSFTHSTPIQEFNQEALLRTKSSSFHVDLFANKYSH